MTTERSLTTRIYDTTFSIWQDNANDPSFRTEIFDGVKKWLRRRGWTLSIDRKEIAHYPHLRNDQRVCFKGPLRAILSISGRHIEFNVWSESWIADNCHGHRYDFNKREKMTYLERLRTDLEFRHFEKWLAKRATIARDKHSELRPSAHAVSALDAIKAAWAKFGHCDPNFGRTVCNYDYNRRSNDGELLQNGQKIWFRDIRGRLRQGVAYYYLNSRWIIATSPWTVEYTDCHSILTKCPANPRLKDNDKTRRRRLEEELISAIHAMNFNRAEQLRKIRFGDAELFMIYNKEKCAFYRPVYAGYTEDKTYAGKYTRAEAASETRRAPDVLRAVTLAGVTVDLSHALAA
jgi:hypothetical protein